MDKNNNSFDIFFIFEMCIRFNYINIFTKLWKSNNIHNFCFIIQIQRKEDGTSILKISSAIPEDKGNYVVKAFNEHGEAKAFARLVVRSLGDFRRKEEFVKMEEKLIAPTFKERFEDRRVTEGVSTKFECIVVGKPSPKVRYNSSFVLFSIVQIIIINNRTLG